VKTCGPGEYATRLGITLQGLRDAATRIGLPWQPGMARVDVESNDAAWQAAYCKGLVKRPAPGQPEDTDDGEANGLEAVKLRKESAQARNWEIRNETLERQLIPASEIVAAWTGISAAVDAAFDSLPAKLAAVLGGDKREAMRKCRQVIEKERNDLGVRVEQLAVEAEAEAPPLESIFGEELEAPPPTPKKPGRPAKKGSPRAS